MINPASLNVAVNPLRQPGVTVPNSDGEPVASVFGAMIRNTLSSVRMSEVAAGSAMKNGGEVHEVVDAVMTAERNLQIVLAVRDRAVGAIQEVTRMNL